MGKRTRCKTEHQESAPKRPTKNQVENINRCANDLKPEQRKLALEAASCPELSFDKDATGDEEQGAGRCVIIASEPDTGKPYIIGEYLRLIALPGLTIVVTKVTNPNLPKMQPHTLEA